MDSGPPVQRSDDLGAILQVVPRHGQLTCGCFTHAHHFEIRDSQFYDIHHHSEKTGNETTSSPPSLSS